MKNDNKCFLYVVKMALHYEVIKKHLQRISRIKPFLSKYNLNWINYPSGKDNWKKCGKNNPTVAFNVLCVKKWIYILHIFQKAN